MTQPTSEKDLWPEDVEDRFDAVRDLEDRDFQAELVRGQIATTRARLREARQQGRQQDAADLQAQLTALLQKQQALLLST